MGMGQEVSVRITEVLEDVNQTSAVLGTLGDVNRTGKWCNYKVDRNSQSIFLFLRTAEARLDCVNHSVACCGGCVLFCLVELFQDGQNRNLGGCAAKIRDCIMKYWTSMAHRTRGLLPIITNKPTQAALHLQESKETRKRGIWSLFRAVYFATSKRESALADFFFFFFGGVG